MGEKTRSYAAARAVPIRVADRHALRRANDLTRVRSARHEGTQGMHTTSPRTQVVPEPVLDRDGWRCGATWPLARTGSGTTECSTWSSRTWPRSQPNSDD